MMGTIKDALTGKPNRNENGLDWLAMVCATLVLAALTSALVS